MNKSKEKWRICEGCLQNKAKTESGKMLFAGIAKSIRKNILNNKKWYNPIRKIGQDVETEDLCGTCGYMLEHTVVGQVDEG
jgi:protein-arginine kinase activator protein McsA